MVIVGAVMFMLGFFAMLGLLSTGLHSWYVGLAGAILFSGGLIVVGIGDLRDVARRLERRLSKLAEELRVTGKSAATRPPAAPQKPAASPPTGKRRRLDEI